MKAGWYARQELSRIQASIRRGEDNSLRAIRQRVQASFKVPSKEWVIGFVWSCSIGVMLAGVVLLLAVR